VNLREALSAADTRVVPISEPAPNAAVAAKNVRRATRAVASMAGRPRRLAVRAF
jgi:hypothetical protein